MSSSYSEKCFSLIEETSKNSLNRLTITDLCQISGVSRSGYYNWLKHRDQRDNRENKDKADFALILKAYNYRGYKKGARSIYMRLLHMGIRMNIKKIRRLMKKYDLRCPIRKANPYRRMAAAIRTNAVADNSLNREFRSRGVRMVLLTDITYIPFQNAFIYLSVIKDAYTEQVLSYVLSESLEVDFVLETIKKLVQEHGTTLDSETLIHSDQGCHYTSIRFRELVDNYGIRRSMSRRGNCWDNAPQESFFGHMKDELKDIIPCWQSYNDAQASIDDWMDYYNNDRCQWILNKLSPNEFYNYIMTGENPISNI